MLKSGDIVLTKVQFTDTFEIKKRPALVLFEEYDNVVVAGVTSNVEMKGIKITKKEGKMLICSRKECDYKTSPAS